MEYGLTDNGFIVKPFEKILEEQKADFKTIFGDDIDLSVESVAGAYCYNQSIKIAQLWELLGGLYASTDVNSATSVYLDRLATFLNVERNPASKTTVAVALWGNNGTNIPAGNITKDENSNQYLLRTATSISKNNAVGIVIKILSKDEDDVFTFTINGTSITYTAGASETKKTIKTALKNAIETAFPNTYIFDNADDDILKFHLSAGTGSDVFVITTDETLEIKKVATIGTYDCSVAGAVYVGTEQLNQVVTKINGLDSVINYIQGETGKDVEDDDTFRIAIKTRQKNASGNEIAIENAIRKLDDVEYVRVYSNREITTDSEGRPPKCYEAVVIGGDDQKIADTIFDVGPAGVQPYGNIEKTVIDSEGFSWTVGFSRPVNKYIWMKIEYALNSEEIANNDIENSIKNNIVDWAENNLEIGIDLIFQKLFTPIYKVNGLKDVVIKIAVTDNLIEPSAGDYAVGDVTIGERELALVDASRIAVALAE